jgi:hypothetical protein
LVVPLSVQPDVDSMRTALQVSKTVRRIGAPPRCGMEGLSSSLIDRTIPPHEILPQARGRGSGRTVLLARSGSARCSIKDNLVVLSGDG